MALLDLVLPPSCAGCGRYGATICGPCRADLRPVSQGSAFMAPDPGIVVGDALVLATSAFAHRAIAQRILRRLKYGGGRRLTAPLAELALPALRRLLTVAGPAVLVPVPLHAARRRDRGYNQAELLAAELGRRAGVDVWPALVRSRATARQHGLDRATRLRNLRDAMALAEDPPADVQAGARAVILVDDILTTGATLEACASVLRAGHVPVVYGFAIAREV